MKKIAEFLKWLESLLGITNVIEGLNIMNIVISWASGSSRATVAINLVDITTVSDVILQAIISFMNENENVITASIVSNSIIVIVNV